MIWGGHVGLTIEMEGPHAILKRKHLDMPPPTPPLETTIFTPGDSVGAVALIRMSRELVIPSQTSTFTFTCGRGPMPS